PAGVRNGDLLVAAVTDWPGQLSAPSGWTLALLPTSNQGIWYRIAANEPASYTWTGSSDSTWSGTIDVRSGVDNTTPLDASPDVNNGSTSSVSWPSVPSVTDMAWSLVVSTEDNNSDSITSPSGYTARAIQGGNSFIRTSTRVISPAGPGAPTATDSSSSPSWAAFSLLLRPSVAGTAITWQTNNAANSRVDYGTTTAYGSNVSDGALVTNHSLTLTGLTAGTTYHYRVTSVDQYGQSASSPDATFTTPAPPPSP